MFARALICVRGRLSRQPQDLGGGVGGGADGWRLPGGSVGGGEGCVHQTRRFISPNAESKIKSSQSAAGKRLLRRLPLRLQDREPGPHCLSCPAPPSAPLPTSASSGAARGTSEAERLAPGLLACGVGGECRGQEERGGRNTRARCPDVPGGLGGGSI